MEKRELSIGFFDSGVGGLSVLKHAREQLPKENFIFYGDNAHAPYGERSEEEIRALSFACCDRLFERGVKALLVACNTATGAAIHAMRERYQIPVVSIEPAIKPVSYTHLNVYKRQLLPSFLERFSLSAAFLRRSTFSRRISCCWPLSVPALWC